MGQRQIAGMELQARGLGLRHRGAVEVITQDGMADGLHMHPQLMGAPSNRLELKPAYVPIGIHRQHLVAGQTGTAQFEIHLLFRAVEFF